MSTTVVRSTTRPEFVRGIADRGEAPPVASGAALVGSYGLDD